MNGMKPGARQGLGRPGLSGPGAGRPCGDPGPSVNVRRSTSEDPRAQAPGGPRPPARPQQGFRKSKQLTVYRRTSRVFLSNHYRLFLFPAAPLKAQGRLWRRALSSSHVGRQGEHHQDEEVPHQQAAPEEAVCKYLNCVSPPVNRC